MVRQSFQMIFFKSFSSSFQLFEKQNMVSPVFILCSVLLLAGVYSEDVGSEVEPTPEATTKRRYFEPHIFRINPIEI